jgi:hypothetical protein
METRNVWVRERLANLAGDIRLEVTIETADNILPSSPVYRLVTELENTTQWRDHIVEESRVIAKETRLPKEYYSLEEWAANDGFYYLVVGEDGTAYPFPLLYENAADRAIEAELYGHVAPSEEWVAKKRSELEHYYY